MKWISALLLVGTVNTRTHCSPRIVNRASRFHKSAGLDDMDHGAGRNSPVLNASGSPTSTGGKLSPSASSSASSTGGKLALSASGSASSVGVGTGPKCWSTTSVLKSVICILHYLT